MGQRGRKTINYQTVRKSFAFTDEIKPQTSSDFGKVTKETRTGETTTQNYLNKRKDGRK